MTVRLPGFASACLVKSKTPVPLGVRGLNRPCYQRQQLLAGPEPSTPSRAGLTLVEIMAAAVILTIAVLGASLFRYHTALSARKADLQTAAVRITLLLCESWRGSSDPNSFDPEEYFGDDDDANFEIDNDEHGPDVPTGFNLLDHYEIVVDGVYYYATLSQKYISTGLRALNVIVAWDQRGYESGDYGQGYMYYLGDVDVYKSFRLTTYVAD